MTELRLFGRDFVMSAVNNCLMAATALLFSYLTHLTTASAAEETCLDVAIVLAVDGSGSIDTEEFNLQQKAIVSALRDPLVQHAIKAAGRVAADVLFWGDAASPFQETGFVLLNGQEDIEALAREVEGISRKVLGNTGLSRALSVSLDRLEQVGCAYRAVINVSGDGSDTVLPRRKRIAPSLREVKKRAEAARVQINALVIGNDEKGLASYFKEQVITGQSAFVMEIDDFSDIGVALRRKLVREISPVALSNN